MRSFSFAKQEKEQASARTKAGWAAGWGLCRWSGKDFAAPLSTRSGAAACNTRFKQKDCLPVLSLCVIYNLFFLLTSVSLQIFLGRETAGSNGGRVSWQRGVWQLVWAADGFKYTHKGSGKTPQCQLRLPRPRIWPCNLDIVHSVHGIVRFSVYIITLY